ncbi:hypothetical protein NHX12_002651 [Muraenolepis orangiensis]|uniref:MUN domain-containing protein n=1 Tax=Muraenolepis orangiensis TaxID=630683 RepID=A0A9Q0DX39_9TELE|nr:hypothetical protein NHX12_002651 [Muraenolepis orangiensis]
MASDMTDACVKRTKAAFDGGLQRLAARGVELRVSVPLVSMFNVLIEARTRSPALCVLEGEGQQQYHARADLLIEEVVGDMVSSLVSKKPGLDLADGYVSFVRQNQEVLRERISDELHTQKVFDLWYHRSVKALCVWLTDRMDLQLHVYQLKTLIRIVKKTYQDFRLQGVEETVLQDPSYVTLYNRLTVEEATLAVRAPGAAALQGVSMKDSDEEDD